MSHRIDGKRRDSTGMHERKDPNVKGRLMLNIWEVRKRIDNMTGIRRSTPMHTRCSVLAVLPQDKGKVVCEAAA